MTNDADIIKAWYQKIGAKGGKGGAGSPGRRRAAQRGAAKRWENFRAAQASKTSKGP